MIFSKATTLALTVLLSPSVSVYADQHNDDQKPKQGVFLLSNQASNEVGVYESLDDGALSWVGSYETGGIGYPDPTDEQNLNDQGGSNSVHYHVWNNKQWLSVANAGGPEGEASVSLMKIDPYTLDLELFSKVDLKGIFGCSVAAHEDRVCAVTCSASVTMECFRIDPETLQLEADYMYDFEENSPPRQDRPNATAAVFGPGNVLFSGDGLQVGTVMKGDAAMTEEERNEFSVPQAGFVSFLIEEDGYSDPSFLDLPNEIIPFAFTWRSGELGTSKQIALIVNIAGASKDFPQCEEGALACRSSVMSLETDVTDQGTLTMKQVDDVALNVVDGCWIDYRFGHFYTGNFFSDTISMGTVARDGTLDWERNVPIGSGTVPNDIVHMGRKIDGGFFIYSENQGVQQLGVHRVIENDSFQLQVLPGVPIPSGITGEDWRGANGLAATLLSEEELFIMYGYNLPDAHSKAEGEDADRPDVIDVDGNDADEDDDKDDASNTANIGWLGTALTATLLSLVL